MSYALTFLSASAALRSNSFWQPSTKTRSSDVHFRPIMDDGVTLLQSHENATRGCADGAVCGLAGPYITWGSDGDVGVANEGTAGAFELTMLGALPLDPLFRAEPIGLSIRDGVFCGEGTASDWA